MALEEYLQSVEAREKAAELFRDENTFIKPCIVDDVPDAHTVWLKVGAQSFCIDGYQETKDEAEWMRLMLARVLCSLQLEARQDIPNLLLLARKYREALIELERVQHLPNTSGGSANGNKVAVYGYGAKRIAEVALQFDPRKGHE